MEDDLNFFGKWKTTFIIWQNGRRPQYLGKWKTTSIYGKLEKTSICRKMEDDLNLLATER